MTEPSFPGSGLLAAVAGETAAQIPPLTSVPVEGGVMMVLLGLGLVVAAALVIRLLVRPVAWGPRVSRLRWRPVLERDGLRLALVLLGVHGLFLTGFALLTRDHPDGRERLAGSCVVVQSLIFHWAILALVAVRLAQRRIPWRAAFGLEGRGAGRRLALGAGLYLASLPLVMGCAFLWRELLLRMGVNPEAQPVVELMAGAHPWALRAYLIALGTLVAPVAEEVLFRGIALPLLAKRFGAGAAVLLTALVFASLHFNAASFGPLLLLGLVLALAYVYSGSLWTPIALHSLFNGVNIALLYAGLPGT